MAGIAKVNLNLSNVPKDKVYVGKKGTYLGVVVTINDEVDQFGNNGSITVEQTKEEREAKSPKIYLGKCKVVWSNGTFPAKAYAHAQPQPQSAIPQADEPDLPF